jgi:hypothetical protein
MIQNQINKANIKRAITQLRVMSEFIKRNQFVDIALIERTSDKSKDWSNDDNCIHFNLFPTRYNGEEDFSESFYRWIKSEIIRFERILEEL